jgi:hypothetical protein
MMRGVIQATPALLRLPRAAPPPQRGLEWRFGWNPEVILFEELPQVENPESDWMKNNNVIPWFVTSGLEMNPEDFPSHLVKRERGALSGARLDDGGRFGAHRPTRWSWQPRSISRISSQLTRRLPRSGGIL